MKLEEYFKLVSNVFDNPSGRKLLNEWQATHCQNVTARNKLGEVMVYETTQRAAVSDFIQQVVQDCRTVKNTSGGRR